MNKKINEDNSFNPTRFSKDEANLTKFKQNLQACNKEFETISQATTNFLELSYKDRDRKILSAKERNETINEYLSKWERIMDRVSGVRDEMMDICDYDLME